MSRSIYRMYDDRYMEVVRMLSVEEIMCVVHDVIMSIEADRLRDLGPTRVANDQTGVAPPCSICGEEKGIRLGWKSLEPVEHAMRTAGMGVDGIQTRSDRVALFGREQADLYDTAREEMDEHMYAVSAIMEEHHVPMALAINLYRLQLDAARMENEALSDVDIPDDLGGFGWSV